MPRKTILILWILVAILGVLTTACSGSTINKGNHSYEMAPMTDMPVEVQSAPEVVGSAYQFAVANPDVLTQLPCYCGCGSMGHTSNYSCYVAEEKSDGAPVFDNHALGCSICVDITEDAMRMLDEGKAMTEIRTYVDQTYSAFGPSNMP